MEDYFEYVGTSHLVRDGLVKRVKSSIPNEFREGYNLKFKRLNSNWKTLYRVSITLNTTEEKIQDFLEKQKNYCFQLDNFSYKIIER
jgi:hypothetical protein